MLHEVDNIAARMAYKTMKELVVETKVIIDAVVYRAWDSVVTRRRVWGVKSYYVAHRNLAFDCFGCVFVIV